MRRQRPSQLLRVERAPLRMGVVVALLSVVVATAVIYPLKAIAPTASLSVVYLPAVLLVSAYWGLALGLATSLISAVAFNLFHLPPVGRLTISDGRNWVALVAFTIVACVVATIAEFARGRALEAERRREEANLAAALARELLAGAQTGAALGASAHTLAQALAMPSAAIELGVAAAGERQLALPVRPSGGEQIATLLVPRSLAPDALERLRDHVLPSLEALVGIALQRDAMQADAVETAALRRSDELKTALLRAVSHDLRTPLTAMVTAGHALGASSLTNEERVELSTAVVEEGERLSVLIDNLLDLSRLQAGRAAPRREWISIEEVLLAACDALPDGAGAGAVRLSLDSRVPALMADSAQLERAFVNLLENARRYSSGRPVSVTARRVGARIVVRVVDQGPGILPGEQERIFEAFYRGAHSNGGPSSGSGLGLAIAKGFVEANGGRISVESLPGQGSSFVVSFERDAHAPVAA